MEELWLNFVPLLLCSLKINFTAADFYSAFAQRGIPPQPLELMNPLHNQPDNVKNARLSS